MHLKIIWPRDLHGLTESRLTYISLSFLTHFISQVDEHTREGNIDPYYLAVITTHFISQVDEHTREGNIDPYYLAVITTQHNTQTFKTYKQIP